MFGKQQAPGPRRVLHLSDLHLSASGFDEDGVDARAALTRLLGDLRHVADVDLVVVSGDVADDGAPGSYALARELVGDFCARRGVPVVYATGNHDARPAFAAVLGSGHHDAHGSDRGVLMDGATRRAAVSEVGGLRVITLDSLVPGAPHGELGDAQLGWLAATLRTTAPAGSIVVVHHPPLDIPSYVVGGWLLRDSARLAGVLAGSDVRAVLCGHLHHQISGAVQGVPVWVTPGVVTRQDTTAPRHLMRGVLGAGASVLDLRPAAPLFWTVAARDPRAGEQVYLYDPAAGSLVDSEG